MPIWYDITAPVVFSRPLWQRLFLPGASGVPPPPADPGISVEPPTGTQTSETERFSHALPVLFNPTTETLRVALGTAGRGYIYVHTGPATYYYRYYLAWGTSASPSATPSSWSGETRVMDYSRTQASTAGWYDEGTVVGAVEATVPPNQWLWARFRGTSWASGSYSNSIGYRTSNIIIVVVL